MVLPRVNTIDSIDSRQLCLNSIFVQLKVSNVFWNTIDTIECENTDSLFKVNYGGFFNTIINVLIV